MSPGLMLSLNPEVALLPLSGICHSGPPKRGKNSQKATASGNACARIRPACRTLPRQSLLRAELVNRSSVDVVSQHTAIK